MEKYTCRTIECFQYQSSYCALTPTQINPLASVGTYRVQHQGRTQLWVSLLHNNVTVLGYCKRRTMLKPLQITFQHVFSLFWRSRVGNCRVSCLGALMQSDGMHLPLRPCFAVKASPWWERK